MKVMIDIFSLCESAPDLVGDSVDRFIQMRRKRNLERPTKRKKIVERVLAKPKKFLHLSEDLLLNYVSKKELAEKVRLAIKNLTDHKLSLTQNTVLEVEDERALRGNSI